MEARKNKLTEYKTIYEGGIGEITEKKSRFIATVRPVETEEEALVFLEEMKKKYWDARHNCYVYSVGANREFTRCSDDGEPSGTAGRPMLDVILGEDIYNVAVVVTRYFGRGASWYGRSCACLFKGCTGRSGCKYCHIKAKGNYTAGYDGLYRDRQDSVYRRRTVLACAGQ